MVKLIPSVFSRMNHLSQSDGLTAASLSGRLLSRNSLTGRPLQLAPCQNVQMEVWHRFSTFRPTIYDDAKSFFGKSLLSRNQWNQGHEVAQEVRVLRGCFAQARESTLRNQQKVNWSLRRNVPKTKRAIILVDDFGWYFSSYNFLKQSGFRHVTPL